MSKDPKGRRLAERIGEYLFAVWLIFLITADGILLADGGGRIALSFFLAQVVMFAFSIVWLAVKRGERSEHRVPEYLRMITVGGDTRRKRQINVLAYAFIGTIINPFMMPVTLLLLWLRQSTNAPLSIVMLCRWVWLLGNIAVAYLLQAEGAAAAALVISVWICFDVMYSAVSRLRQTPAGVVLLFLDQDDELSPLQILICALLFGAAFGCIVFHIWSADKEAYHGISGWQDCIYFSIVTLATVGYGDIYPTHPAARWACISEIIGGLTLLIVAVNASLGAWLQRHQPVPGINPISGGKLITSEDLAKSFKEGGSQPK